MHLSPTPIDIWIVTNLARLLGRFPIFDRGIQSAVGHHVLGGFWFAASLFVIWMQAARGGHTGERRRILTILLGSVLASVLVLVTSMLVVWPSPNQHPTLSRLFPRYLYDNPNHTSFPSASTALYSCVALGVMSVRRRRGWTLLASVVLLVALPRMYVGGHYLSDVVAGLVLGLVSYIGARCLLEARVVPVAERFLSEESRFRVLGELLVFAWIWQVAVEFREVVWGKNSLEYLFHYFIP